LQYNASKNSLFAKFTIIPDWIEKINNHLLPGHSPHEFFPELSELDKNINGIVKIKSTDLVMTVGSMIIIVVLILVTYRCYTVFKGKWKIFKPKSEEIKEIELK